MKSGLKLALWMAIVSMLGGCWDRTELNDLAMITALAIDQTDDNKIRTTVQVMIPQNQSGGASAGMSSGGGAKQTTVRSSDEGVNLADALSRLQQRLPRKLFWGQCKIFILSEKLAKSGIKEQFDLMVRHPQLRERGNMFVSEGQASKALELFPPIERSSAEVLRKLSDLQIGASVTLEQLSMKLKDNEKAFFLPLVRILPPVKSAEMPFITIPYIQGTTIFKGDIMIGTISERTTRGVLWVRDEIDEYTVTFQIDEEGLVSLKPVNAHVELLPAISGDKWLITVKVRAQGDIVQNGTSLNPLNPRWMHKLNEAFKHDVRQRIERALNEVQRQYKADIFGFATAFHRKYPRQWEANKQRWDEIFPAVEVRLDIETTILRPGLVNAPAGMPIDEVKR